MLIFIKHLLWRIDEEMVLKWFGLSNFEKQDNSYFDDGDISLNTKISTDISAETFRLILDGFWDKVQDGLTLNDIDRIIFFILFIRFVILSLRYNLKTSFCITCISFASGYLWYKHLLKLIVLYRSILLKVPFFNGFAYDGLDIRAVTRQNYRNTMMLRENVRWYDIGRLAYYSFTKGIVDLDRSTGLRKYIDPISMIVSNLDEPLKSQVVPYYYKIYNQYIPKLFRIWCRFWIQTSSLIGYVFVVRISKKYCPYAVRWHWTFIIILGFVEQILRYFTNRLLYFQYNIIWPKVMEEVELTGYLHQDLLDEFHLALIMLGVIAVSHISFVFLCLLHAICGQYFYIPVLTDNTELHIGPRPTDSIYSGGYTSWQDEEEKRRRLDPNLIIPNMWFGWFGNSDWKPLKSIMKSLKRAIRLLIKKFRKK